MKPVAWIKIRELSYMKAVAEHGKDDWQTNLGLKPEPDDEGLYTETQVQRMIELLERCENEMRYAGWTKFESDNTARNGVYEQVKEFLAQPEPEPVGWEKGNYGIGFKEPMPHANYKVTATIAPQREWQGLTDGEIEKLYLGSFDEGQFARAIEAKLKEKNT